MSEPVARVEGRGRVASDGGSNTRCDVFAFEFQVLEGLRGSETQAGTHVFDSE